MGNYCRNIFSKLRRGDTEKRRKSFTGGWGKGRTCSKKLARTLRSVLDPSQSALSELLGMGPEALGKESGFYQHMVWQELTSTHPKSEQMGLCWRKELLLTLRFRGFVG